MKKCGYAILQLWILLSNSLSENFREYKSWLWRLISKILVRVRIIVNIVFLAVSTFLSNTSITFWIEIFKYKKNAAIKSVRRPIQPHFRPTKFFYSFKVYCLSDSFLPYKLWELCIKKTGPFASFSAFILFFSYKMFMACSNLTMSGGWISLFCSVSFLTNFILTSLNFILTNFNLTKFILTSLNVILTTLNLTN